jgi:branched-chain amino acid transport system ATP-binding protein
MDVEENSVVSLLGRNGAGKTTTLRAIMGLIELNSGSIQFDNEDLVRKETYQRYNLGISFVPETRQIFPDLTVRENLNVPPVEGADNEWTISELFDVFPKLEQIQSSKGKHLSGGEKQILSIARSLRPGPKLLLLDEPTEGLAPQIIDDVVSVINDLKKMDMSVLIVEQNINVALDIAEFNYILKSGKIVYSGPSDQLRENREIVNDHMGVSM